MDTSLVSVAAHVISWATTASALATLLVTLGYRLLSERARRRTLVEFCREAPIGTVMIQDRGPGAPAVWVWVGGEKRTSHPIGQTPMAVCVEDKALSTSGGQG